MGRAIMHGWIALPNMGEILMEHGVPRMARACWGDMVDVERLIDEIAEVSGLHVTVGRWQVMEGMDEMEAPLHVDAGEIAEVLRRLAHASAETFYDRYHKCIDASDTDYDDEAYAMDFGIALGACGLRWGEADQPALRGTYCSALHAAAEEMAGLRH